jgi:hypothetical protein
MRSSTLVAVTTLLVASGCAAGLERRDARSSEPTAARDASEAQNASDGGHDAAWAGAAGAAPSEDVTLALAKNNTTRPKAAAACRVGAVSNLVWPQTRQVVQRGGDHVGSLQILGNFTGCATGFQARTVRRNGTLGATVGWTTLGAPVINGNAFFGVLRQPQGGWFDLQVRPVYQGKAGAARTVAQVGVGLVFVVAGQSNASNNGAPTGVVPNDRMSAYDFDRGLWRNGRDPQPAPDGSPLGSVWPTTGSNLAVALGVPVGFYNVAYGGTAVAQWQPNAAPPNHGPMPLFTRLVAALKYLGSQGGVQAVLWDQGESDYGAQTPAATYRALLGNVLFQAHAQSGVPHKWMIAFVGCGPCADQSFMAAQRGAQASLVDNVTYFGGPNTDALGAAFRLADPATGVNVHFNALGLTTLGAEWGRLIANTPGFL